MPGLKRIISAADPAERKRRRATLGGLQELKASKAAQTRYDVAVNYFLWVSIYLHGHLARSDEELDQHCAEFLKLCWSEGNHAGLRLIAYRVCNTSCRESVYSLYR